MTWMKIPEIIEKLLSSPNIANTQPIYEKYDKNVQGNTARERGKVAASICTPFRDFDELPGDKSKTGVAIATGGNPNLAKIDAKAAAINAVCEATIKLACVGAIPLAATDCLNFGNPEKSEQMGEFVAGMEGVKEACEALEIPIVSGNVSLYNETRGKSIPPSAIISVFGRVDDPKQVPQLAFQKAGETIFCIRKRSDHLGGSEFLKVCEKEDFRIPEIDLVEVKNLASQLQKIATKNKISTANPILRGGLIVSVLKSCFKGNLGAEIQIPTENVPGFLFGEDLGVIVTTKNPEPIKDTFGEEAIELGKTTKEFKIALAAESETLLDQSLDEWKNLWENELRKIF